MVGALDSLSRVLKILFSLTVQSYDFFLLSVCLSLASPLLFVID